MKQENKALLIQYLICFGVASLITVAVFAMQGFFTDNLAINLQILTDGFMVSGGLLLMFAGLLFVSSQGALIGIGFALRNAVLTWFVPFGKKKQERYYDYRERKTAELKKKNSPAIFVTGLAFFVIGLILMVIWLRVTGYQSPQ